MSPKAASAWFFLIVLLAPPLAALAGADDLQYPQSRELKALVDDAAALISQKGEAAFAEFRQKGSRWFQGERYLFVDALDGVEVCNSAFPELEGRNLLHLKDAWGKPVIAGNIAAATRNPARPYGWVHALWPKPGQREPTWKTSYVRLAVALSGKKYVVGSGLYDLKTEPAMVKEKVEQAAALIREKGKAAFAALRDRAGQFIFRDTYVWVSSVKGVELVNPAFPNLEGRNLWDLQDAKGRYTLRLEAELVKSQGQGWIKGQWAKPGQAKLSDTLAYVKGVKVDGELLMVGCSIYLD